MATISVTKLIFALVLLSIGCFITGGCFWQEVNKKGR